MVGPFDHIGMLVVSAPPFAWVSSNASRRPNILYLTPWLLRNPLTDFRVAGSEFA